MTDTAVSNAGLRREHWFFFCKGHILNSASIKESHEAKNGLCTQSSNIRLFFYTNYDFTNDNSDNESNKSKYI